MKTRFYFDQHGYPRVETEARYEAIAHWLEGDVQSSIDFCDDLVDLIKQIEDKRLAGYEGTGNSSTLIIKPNGARIENEFAMPYLACDLSLDQLKSVIQQWRKLIMATQMRP